MSNAGAPYHFDLINQLESCIVPGTLRPADNRLAQYYRRYLAQRLFATYRFSGVPPTWDMEYVASILMAFGYLAVIRTDRFGVIPQQCGVSGYNVFYRPTRAIVTNPLFGKTYDLRIGDDCELLRMTPDWRGVADLIGHYADLLALTATSIIVNLYNSRLAYVFSGTTKAIAESFKGMYDQLARGNPAVFVDKQLFQEDGSPNWLQFEQNLGQNFIVDKLQAAERCLMSQFFQDIGIPNIPFEKGERLNMEESTRNEYGTECLIALWKRTLQTTADKVNAMFDLSIKVDYNEDLEEAYRDEPTGKIDTERDA